MIIKVFCVVSMLSKLPLAVCLRGEQQACNIKEGGATGFLWNFHRYRLVYYNYSLIALDCPLDKFHCSIVSTLGISFTVARFRAYRALPFRIVTLSDNHDHAYVYVTSHLG